jgi:hypothetical protein
MVHRFRYPTARLSRCKICESEILVRSDHLIPAGGGLVTHVDAILASAMVHYGGSALCTEEQPLMVNGAWTAAETLVESGAGYSLVEREAVAIALRVSPTQTFIVNGCLAHNK